MVNGVDQSSVVDQVFQALDQGSGHKQGTPDVAHEEAVDQILQTVPSPAGSSVYRTKLHAKSSQSTAPLVPPSCQGAACMAASALKAFVAACASDRRCLSELLGQGDNKQ